MRFGKRLVELQSQIGQAGRPYISYKELKRIVGELNRLAGSAGGLAARAASTADSSDDEVLQPDDDLYGASSNCIRSNLEARQQDFFSRIDDDLSLASDHIQTILAMLEAGLGDWQVEAAVCGLLFTQQQLEEVAANLPFECSDHQAILQWLRNLPSADDDVWPARQALTERYGHIADELQVLLQYIEVNVTAVRKILKKFEKKVPPEFRVLLNTKSYKAHHMLFSPDLLDLVVAVAQIQRLMLDMQSMDPVDVRASLVSPISFIGPESLQILQQLDVKKELSNFLGGNPTPAIVYAKPSSKAGGPTGKGVCADITVQSQLPGGPHASAVRAATSSSPLVPSSAAPSAGGGEGGGRGGGVGGAGGGAGRNAAPKGSGKRGSKGKEQSKARGGERGTGGSKPGGKGSSPNHFAAGTRKGQNASNDRVKGGRDANANPNNMQCMFMMVPPAWGGAWNQPSQAPAMPPGSFKTSGAQMMSSMPGAMKSVDPNQMADWRAAMPQQMMVDITAMQMRSAGYPQGIGHGYPASNYFQ